MKAKPNQLEKFLAGLRPTDKVDPRNMSPQLRAFVKEGGKCTMLNWTYSEQVSFLKNAKANNSLMAVLTSGGTIAEQLLHINLHVQSVCANFSHRIGALLQQTLDCILSKTWLSKTDVLCDKSEKAEIEVVNTVTLDQIEALDLESLQSFGRSFSQHTWLSNHFDATDTDTKKIHKALLKVRKRLKNKEDARNSRKRKATELADSKSKCAKNDKMISAARALQESAELHSIRGCVALCNDRFKQVAHFFK